MKYLSSSQLDNSRTIRHQNSPQLSTSLHLSLNTLGLAESLEPIRYVLFTEGRRWGTGVTDRFVWTFRSSPSCAHQRPGIRTNDDSKISTNTSGSSLIRVLIEVTRNITYTHSIEDLLFIYWITPFSRIFVSHDEMAGQYYGRRKREYGFTGFTSIIMVARLLGHCPALTA